MVTLSVNVNKIALLRNARGGDCPNLMHFVALATHAGAHGITVHPRPDQRHITVGDAQQIGDWLRDKPQEYNIEGNPFEGAMGTYPGFMALVKDAQPNQCTLVPDTIHQKTSDHGWDFQADGDGLRPIIQTLKAMGIRVSVFVDPTDEAIDGAKKLGVDRIEFYTESYAHAYSNGDASQCFHTYQTLAKRAHAAGLGLNAGHDLNLKNIGMFSSLPYLQEVSIGQALIADALELGFLPAIQAYLKELRSSLRIVPHTPGTR